MHASNTKAQQSPIAGEATEELRPNVLEVDATAIMANTRAIRALVGRDVQLYAALKSDAYGFGLIAAARAVESAGAHGIALVDIADALRLRTADVALPILLYTGAVPSSSLAQTCSTLDLMPTVLDRPTADLYSAQALPNLKVFVKVDIGLERLGVYPEEAISLAEHIHSLPGLILQGLYTHFHVRPDSSLAYLDWQFQRFSSVIDALASRGINVPVQMAASSAPLRASAKYALNAVDPGHLLFGLWPPGPSFSQLSLRPAFRSLKTSIVFIKTIERASWNEAGPYRVEGKLRMGVVPIGRSHGIDAANAGTVLVRGTRVPFVGDFSAEHAQLDLGAVPDTRVGDEVVLIGRQGDDEITLDEVAKHGGFSNKSWVVKSLHPSVPRRYQWET